MTVKEKLSLSLRGGRLLHKLVPGAFLAAFIQNLFRALTPFINVWLSAQIITFLADGRPLEDLLWLAAAAVGVNLLLRLIENGSGRAADYLIDKSWLCWQLPLWEKVQQMDYEQVEDARTHKRLGQIQLMQQSGGLGLMQILFAFFHGCRGFFLTVFSLAMTISAFAARPNAVNGPLSLLFSPWFTALMLLFTAAYAAASGFWNFKKAKETRALFRTFEGVSRYETYFRDLIRQYKAGKELKIYGMRGLLKEELDRNESRPINRFAKKWQRINCRYNGLGAAVSTLFLGVVYAYVALKALAGAFGVGKIVQYAGSLTQLSTGITLLIGQIAVLLANADALKEYFGFLGQPDRKYQGSLPVEKRADNEYEIEFHDVSFRYPGAKAYALRHVSLKFHIGRRMAVVGRNGSGKTTMIKLLCRLYDPTEGHITLNGIDIRKYDYQDYLGIFSVVFQDFKLFSFSLGQNVAASFAYDAGRAADCLNRAGFGDRLARLPKGLDTPLYRDFSEDGVEISGGEAQKIALARALYKGAPFIILDEPTAALDPIAEFDIYSHFDQIVGEKTAVYISHRLSSCRFCGDILVFDQGRLIQRGSHDQLIQDSSGQYYRLWHAQAQYYEKAE